MKYLSLIKQNTSIVSLYILFAFILVLSYFYHAPIPLSWDTIGYHSYFVELITDGDLLIEDLLYYQHILDTYQNAGSLYQFVPTETGNHIPKYSIGWSILNAPFMFIGHLFAAWLNYPQDGFSTPYQLATIFSSLTYTFIGLIYFKKLLIQFFTKKITILLLIILVLGTNYLHINYACIGIIHVYLFPLYAALLYYSYQFHQENNLKHAIYIGSILGLMVLCRPTEIIAVIIPLLYGVHSLKLLSDRIIKFFRTNYYYIAILIFIVLISIQLFYWKYTTGQWVFYSYTNPGEGLDLNNPHLIQVLFSFRKGWWIYTPVMLLTIPGFIYCYKKYRKWFWPLLIFTVVNLYIISSWTTWWYAGSFSSRALEHSYPIYLLLIGFFIAHLKDIKFKIATVFIGILICLNLFQTWQVQNGILDMFRMSKSYYISIIGQVTPPTEKQKELLLIDRSLTSFENKDEYKLILSHKMEDYPKVFSTDDPYSKLFQFEYQDLTVKDHLWIKAQAQLKHENDSIKNGDLIAFHLCGNALHNTGVYGWRSEQINSLCSSKCTLEFDYLTPHIRSRSDTISIGLWHQFGPSVKVDNFYIEVYEPQ